MNKRTMEIEQMNQLARVSGDLADLHKTQREGKKVIFLTPSWPSFDTANGKYASGRMSPWRANYIPRVLLLLSILFVLDVSCCCMSIKIILLNEYSYEFMLTRVYHLDEILFSLVISSLFASHKYHCISEFH